MDITKCKIYYTTITPLSGRMEIIMKKIIGILLCAIMIALSFTACSANNEMTEENIEKTVDAAFSALVEFDTDKLDKYVESSTLSVIIGYAEKHDQFVDLGKAIFANLTYEITNIDVENAQVTVSVKNKDLFQAASEFAQELKTNYSTLQLLRKLDDDEFLDRKLNALCESIANARITDASTEITLKVEQGKKNLVLVFNSEAEDSVSGSALNAIKNIYSLGL